MPRSPLTLALGLAIEAAFFLFLLWPDQALQEWGGYAAMLIAFIIGVYTWRAVRDAPPLDDQAFHRTLPPGDGHAFRKVLAIQAWVLVGIALAVVVYCWIFNCGWQVTSYGVLVFTLPMWCLMAANGIASSLATSRQFGKIWGYAAVFGTPLISAAIIYHLRDGLRPVEFASNQYLNSHRMIVLTCGILYPMIWWLVAIGRRKITAICLAAAIGIFIPIIHVYGGFFNAQEEWAPEKNELSRVSLTRKTIPPGDDPWIPIDDMITVNGLRDGEIIQLRGMIVDRESFRFFGVPDDEKLREEGLFSDRRLMASIHDGRITWGQAAVWKQLKKQIPGLETIDYLGGGMDVPAHVSTLRPGETALIRSRNGRSDSKPKPYQQKGTYAYLNSAPWGSIAVDVYRYEKVGMVDVEKGGDIRLSGGGILSIKPLVREDENLSIELEHFQPSLSDADGLWFKMRKEGRLWDLIPWLIAVDRAGKHAYALSVIDYENGREVMLGRLAVWSFQSEKVSNAENRALLEMLRGCSLHVFQPREESRFYQDLLPPR